MFNNAIYISVKPKFTKLIESGEKNYEFRKYMPKEEVKTLFIYESLPLSRLTYIIELGDIIHYPNKIDINGYGNIEFNEGLKVSKYAYFLKKVYKLEEPILLKDLKKYGFNAPQAYSYDYRYPELTEYIKSQQIKLIINREDLKN